MIVADNQQLLKEQTAKEFKSILNELAKAGLEHPGQNTISHLIQEKEIQINELDAKTESHEMVKKQ
jgi:hypothetical protein